jgi:Ca2+-transporting ATPase
VFDVGLLSNRLLLVGIAVEVALIAVLTSVPGLQDVFHMRPLDARLWAFLLIWPPVVLGVEEARKAILRRGELPTTTRGSADAQDIARGGP